LQLVRYTDSDFARYIDNRKFTTGYVFLMAGGAVSWKSVKQTTCCFIYDGSRVRCLLWSFNQAIRLRNFVSGLQLVDLVKRSLQLYYDNRPAELYCKSDKSSARSRHIDIKFLVVKDRVRNNIMSVDSISTSLNITDPLTKGLPSKVFLEHVTHMGMASPYDILILWEWIVLCNKHYF